MECSVNISPSDLVYEKTQHVNILCGSQRAMSVPGIFTKVQEVIRLFTVTDYIRTRGGLPSGDEVGCG